MTRQVVVLRKGKKSPYTIKSLLFLNYSTQPNQLFFHLDKFFLSFDQKDREKDSFSSLFFMCRYLLCFVLLCCYLFYVDVHIYIMHVYSLSPEETSLLLNYLTCEQHMFFFYLYILLILSHHREMPTRREKTTPTNKPSKSSRQKCEMKVKRKENAPPSNPPNQLLFIFFSMLYLYSCLCNVHMYLLSVGKV